MWWNGVVDEGKESSGELVRWDMSSGKGGSGVGVAVCLGRVGWMFV